MQLNSDHLQIIALLMTIIPLAIFGLAPYICFRYKLFRVYIDIGRVNSVTDKTTTSYERECDKVIMSIKELRALCFRIKNPRYVEIAAHLTDIIDDYEKPEIVRFL